MGNPISLSDNLGLQALYPTIAMRPAPARPPASGNSIAAAASAHIGEGGWGNPGLHGGPGFFTEFKCNIFVNQVIKEAGGNPPIVNGRPATAGELGNASVSIPGWPVVTDGSVRNGDIVSIAKAGDGYTGHTGIVSVVGGVPGTVSADSNAREITIGPFGFRQGNQSQRVIRRCDCSK